MQRCCLDEVASQLSKDEVSFPGSLARAAKCEVLERLQYKTAEQ